VFATTNGGRNAEDWTAVLADPTGGWLAGNFTFRSDLEAFVTGSSLCHSATGGFDWTSRTSADPVFDNGVWFTDPLYGWSGGGQISAPISGWVHRSTDGGASWSGRVLEPAYPIRAVMFLDRTTGFAVGGTRFGGAGGGIWLSTDGGVGWELDEDTGSEMMALDWQTHPDTSVTIWCVGFTADLQGVIYKKTHLRPATDRNPCDQHADRAAGPDLGRHADKNPNMVVQSDSLANGHAHADPDANHDRHANANRYLDPRQDAQCRASYTVPDANGGCLLANAGDDRHAVVRRMAGDARTSV